MIFQITQQQAQRLAKILLHDIDSYIQTHDQEFKAFLEGQANNGGEKNDLH